MTNTHARTTANVLLASAGVAVVYVIWTKPPLRRLAFQLARLWIGAYVPAYLAGQVRQAWLEAGRPRGQHHGTRIGEPAHPAHA